MSLKRPASAFAPGTGKDGRTLSWEYIFDAPIPSPLLTVIPSVARVVGGITTNFLTIIPVNVTRGAVTLERVRGTFGIYFEEPELAINLAGAVVHMQMQLVPARNGAIVNTAVLSPDNAADQESNKIIWQRIYYPLTGEALVLGGNRFRASSYIGQEVDIKVKRRFDRALYALALVVEVEGAAGLVHMAYGGLRGLFLAPDAV